MFTKRYFNMMFKRRNFYHLLYAIIEGVKDLIINLLDLFMDILMLILYPFVMLIWTINEDRR